MTKIDPQSPTIRESTALYRGRPIVVEMHCSYIVFRVKGLKTVRGTLSIDGALERALQVGATQTASQAREGKHRKVRRGLLAS
jgi:hypothetical protein